MYSLPLDQEARAEAVVWWRRAALTPEVRRGVAEGKMFGLLLCQVPNTYQHAEQQGSTCTNALPLGASWVDPSRSLVSLVAFSGQLDGVWERPGWAPSLLNHHRVAGESWRAQRDLHRLSHNLKLAQRGENAESARELKRMRRERSNEHARYLRDQTFITCMSGEIHALSTLWPDAATGVGECCAPKLLCWAVQLGFEPLGLAEFCIVERRLRPPRADLLDQHEVIFSIDHSTAQRSPSGGVSLQGEPSRGDTSPETLSFYAPCRPRCQPLMPLIFDTES